MKKKGFSLVEILVTMLIVAVIIAATAPSITKKVQRDATDKIFDMLPSDPPNAVEYVKGRNQRIYMNTDTNNGYIGIVHSGKTIPTSSVIFGSNERSSDNANTFVGIGFLTRNAAYSVALGNSAKAEGANSIAIGTQTQARENSIAIGNIAGVETPYNYYDLRNSTGYILIGQGTHGNNNSIAIGNGAVAKGENSIAIGHGVQANDGNTIVLGDASKTVVIPGNLIVKKKATLGADKAWTSVTELLTATNYGEGDAQTELSHLYNGNNNGNPQWFFRTAEANATPKIKELISSDIRLKNVGKKFTSGLEELSKLDFYNFTFKADKNNTPQVGVIAQDLQKVFPNSVTVDVNGYLTIRWDEMFYTALNAIKELGVKFKELSDKLSLVQSETQELKTVVEKQQSLIDAQAKLLNEQQKQINELSKKVSKLERKNKNKLSEE